MIYNQTSFIGGENLRLFPDYMGENQVIRAKNMVLTDAGWLETRFGKQPINTTSFGSGAILGVWRYVKEDGSEFLVVHHGTQLYAAAWDGSSVIESFSIVKTGLTTDKLTGLVWKNLLILGNGENTPFYFNGVSCADLGGTPPKFKVFTVYAGRIWCVDADNPSLIRFSGLEDMNSWDALDIINVRDQDGDRIRGLIPIEGGLVIAKDTSIWPLYGSSRVDLRLGLTPIDDTAGCYSDEGSLPQGVIWTGENINMVGLAATQVVADSHTPLFKTLTDAQKRACFVGSQPNIKRGLLHIPATDTTVVLDGRRGAITTWEGLNANCFAVADGVGDDHRLIVGDANVGMVYMLTGANDNGEQIDWEAKLGYVDHGTTARDKVWRFVEADVVLRESSGEIMDGAGGFIQDGYGGNISGGTSVPYSVAIGYDIDFKDKTGSMSFQGVAQNQAGWDTDDFSQSLWGFQGYPEQQVQYWIHGARGNRMSMTLTGSQRALIRGMKCMYQVVGNER